MANPYRVQNKPTIQWSKVEKTLITLAKLELLTLSQKTLRKEGYVLEPLSEQEIWKKMRCQNCGQKLKHYRPPIAINILDDEDDSIFPDDDFTGFSDDGFDANKSYAHEITRAAQSTCVQKHHCFFHDGQLFKGIWQCCDGRSNTKGCCSNIDHVAGNVDELAIEWVFNNTPAPVMSFTSAVNPPNQNFHVRGDGRHGRNQTRYKNTHSTYTAPHPVRSIRTVVALDCEMGISRLGNTELIRLSLIDFFTQESLVDSLVIPDVEMAHYNTRYSGVTFAAMNKAKRTNTGIRGADAARKEVFKYIDSNTIVVVHGGSNDFTSLRWIHPASRTIDTCVLETYDYQVRENRWKKSLKEVCKRRCGILVQDAKLENGRLAGHDSLEDALATREVVCWWLKMISDQ